MSQVANTVMIPREEYDALVQQRDDLQKVVNRLQYAEAQIAALALGDKQLLKDAERLNWLESNPRHAQIVVDGKTVDCVFYGISCAELVPLRAAIDAAMKEQK